MMDEAALLVDCVLLVHAFFGGNAEKTRLWFGTPNPLLGQIPPIYMVESGRVEKLHRFITAQLEENKS